MCAAYGLLSLGDAEGYEQDDESSAADERQKPRRGTKGVKRANRPRKKERMRAAAASAEGPPPA